jgi:methylated-DNA-protein-cysteine methyltransferase-like protein
MDQVELPYSERSKYFAQVWKIVKQIPAGKVATYGQIAVYIPRPAGIAEKDFLTMRARWVGYAMGSSPGDVPWQRVINSQGKVSPRSGAEMQQKLLEAEGVQFDSRQRVDLAKFSWQGPSKEWLADNSLVVPEQ